MVSFSGNHFDAAIVGSGPAGSSAALALAKEGFNVLIVEKASLPRYKTCGGGVVRRARNLLPVNIDRVVKQNCSVAELHLHDTDLHFRAMRHEAIITMTMREDFDLLLLHTARDDGAVVLAECEVLDVTQDRHSVTLTTTQGNISAKFVIAADGVTSIVAKKCGWKENRRVVPALEYEVSVSQEILQRFNIAARFDFGIVPQGYAWIFPKGDHLSVGVLTTRRGSANLNEYIKEYFMITGLTDITRTERHGFMIPLSPRKDSFVKNRVLLVGDAAGFVDPVTAEGITFAIKSGQLAAGALIEGNFDQALVSRIYTSALKKFILPEIRAASILSKLLYDFSSMRTWLFRNYGSRLCEAMVTVVTGERTYHEMLFNPKNYVRLLHQR
ncbi:MAG: geranylgeranyl reductase family protein [Ignavibacteria bacterium]|nr:geranylgeranyl reductase family protein [Ignavibacteria bacterium]MBI3764968.1 geranylgeranyl reductase family protein [Ignavibacteriales bacterium]